MRDVHINPKKILQKYQKRIEGLDSDGKEKFEAYLYVIFSLITLSFFGVFAIRPTLSTISKLNQQYREAEITKDALVIKSTALKNLDIQYQQLTPDLPLIYNAVPKTTKMAYVTRQIESLAQKNGLQLISLNFGTVELYPATKENPSLYSFTFNAVLEGNEDNVKSFIRDVIQFDRLVNIELLNTGNRETGEYGISLTGKVYFSKT